MDPEQLDLSKLPRPLSELLAYCEEHPHQLSNFIVSVAQWALKHRGTITPKQRTAILKIHDQYGVFRWITSLPADHPVRLRCLGK